MAVAVFCSFPIAEFGARRPVNFFLLHSWKGEICTEGLPLTPKLVLVQRQNQVKDGLMFVSHLVEVTRLTSNACKYLRWDDILASCSCVS